MTTNLELILALIAGSGAGVMLLSMVLLRITLTRRLKKHLKPRDEYWESRTLDFGFLNTAIFGWACVIPKIERTENFKRIYVHLNVKQFSNTAEKVIAHLMIIGLVIFGVFGVWHASINTV
jgi:hypothetical protein